MNVYILIPTSTLQGSLSVFVTNSTETMSTFDLQAKTQSVDLRPAHFGRTLSISLPSQAICARVGVVHQALVRRCSSPK